MVQRLLPILTAASCIAPAAAADKGAKEMVIEPSEKQLKQIRAQTPERVANGVKITDDSLETIATLTTYDAYLQACDIGRFRPKVGHSQV